MTANTEKKAKKTAATSIGCFQTGCFAPRFNVTTATIKAPPCFCLFGLWPKIQATCFAGGRWPDKISGLFDFSGKDEKG
jgi:hypothetical protein